MNKIFHIFTIVFLLGGFAEEQPTGKISPAEPCKPEIYSVVPENLVVPPKNILEHCQDFENLNIFPFDKVWPGWSEAPTDLLIIDEDFEYLFTIQDPVEGFAPTGYSKLFARPTVFATNLKATFPAFSATPVIVIGRPSPEEIESKAWISTLFHEHFHQFQMSRPGYWEATEALDLAGNDSTGMWMINYPFPYEEKAVYEKFSEMSQDLMAAYKAIGKPFFKQNLEKYLKTKKEFSDLVGEKDYRYFQMQIWQEGLARYTELKVFEAFFKPDQITGKEFPFERLNSALKDLGDPTLLVKDKRVSFYSFGIIEGLVLDEANPNWKEKYWEEWFQVDSFYK